MSRRISLAWLAMTAVLAGAAVALFAVLNAAFGGPDLPGAGQGPGQRLTATFPDSQGLVNKSLVLVRGVHVGDVAELEPVGDGVRVTLRVDRDRTPVHRDAEVRVGHRTLFGEAYVALDPGRPAAGRLPEGAALPARQVHRTVELDEALEALGPRARRRLGSLGRTGAAVAAEGRSAPRLNRTLGGLAGTAEGLRRLGAALRGQEGDVAALLSNARDVVDELSARDRELQTVVASGRAATEALSADGRALRDGLAEASRLLGVTRTTLRDADPLLREAGPVLARVVRAAPDLTGALRELPPATAAARRAVAALAPARKAAVPTLRLLRAATPALGAAIGPLETALRNLVPALGYIAPYKGEIVGFVASGEGIRALRPDGTATAATLEDARYRPFERMGDPGAPYGWARFFVEGNTGAFTGSAAGVGDNPYPPPGDPYTDWRGTYPRLTAAPAPAP